MAAGFAKLYRPTRPAALELREGSAPQALTAGQIRKRYMSRLYI